jgi:polyphenol oxidase
VASALTALRDLDAGPLRAWLGPAICGACYEVPAAMQAEVAGVVPETLSTTSRGTAGLDLRRGVAAQLRAAGVTAVRVSDVCTAEDPAYFSYRRDGVTGRFAGVAVLG